MTNLPDGLTSIGTCECGTTLIPWNQWEKIAPQHRRQLRREHGITSHHCRGLCNSCAGRRRKAGTLIDVERRSVPSADVLDAWESDGHNADDSQASRIRHLAPRLGMTPKALEMALRRAKKRATA